MLSAALTCGFVPVDAPVEASRFHTVSHDAPTVMHVHAAEHDPDATVGLYGMYSGFAKARVGVLGERRTITVGSLPEPLRTEANMAILDEAMDEWNRAAGWELFTPDFTGGPVDVSFVQNADETCPNYGACVGWDQFPTGWYEHCYVMLHEWMPPLRTTIAHELGHCLGFEDVPTSGAYVGIMSYARRGDLWPNNPQDVASLAAVGYRV